MGKVKPENVRKRCNLWFVCLFVCFRWVNRKDPSGKNLFGGGFLGLDNIGVFDRSKPLPMDAQLEQVCRGGQEQALFFFHNFVWFLFTTKFMI